MKRYRFIGTEEEGADYSIPVKFGDVFDGDYKMTPVSDTIEGCANFFKDNWEEVIEVEQTKQVDQ